jgi:hypothetical protein
LVADAEETLSGLGEAAQAAEDGDRAEARRLQRAAMRDLARFYRTYGAGAGG